MEALRRQLDRGVARQRERASVSFRDALARLGDCDLLRWMGRWCDQGWAGVRLRIDGAGALLDPGDPEVVRAAAEFGARFDGLLSVEVAPDHFCVRLAGTTEPCVPVDSLDWLLWRTGSVGDSAASDSSDSSGSSDSSADRRARRDACGPRGPRGPRGHCGARGPRGHRGPPGPRGPRRQR